MGLITHTGIEGVCLEPLAIIPAAGGPVLKMLSPKSRLLPDFTRCFGEIYFSVVERGAVKAWKRHRRQTQLFAVPSGLIRIVCYDGRPDSQSCGRLFVTELGLPDHYALLRIPPGIWYGFAALSEGPALICNCADIPHDPEEGEKLPLDSPTIPYDWRA